MTLKEAIELLRHSGVDSPEHDARELFKAFGLLSPAEPFTLSSSSDTQQLLDALDRRAAGEPLQYIIGEVGFYREVYTVSPYCLIPRSDTEILVDYAVKNIPRGESFLDLCCGSGCIGISTLANTRDTRCLSVDVSDEVLDITRQNAQRNGVLDRLTTMKIDLLTGGEELTGEYFAVLSNPPYISEAVYRTLQREIFHEPRIAFVGGENGLMFYERLVPLSLRLIKQEGFIAFEIGYDQADALRAIAQANACTCEIIKDYSGCDRVAILRRN